MSLLPIPPKPDSAIDHNLLKNYDPLRHFTEGDIDHGNISGLTDDDHSQYALLAGRSGGQTLIGDTAASGNLTLQSTSDATKGNILFGVSAYNEALDRMGLGTNDPSYRLHVKGANGILGLFNNSDNSNDLAIELQAATTRIFTNFSSTMLIGTDTDRFTLAITSGRRVGINDTSPSACLSVFTNGLSDPLFHLGYTSDGDVLEISSLGVTTFNNENADRDFIFKGVNAEVMRIDAANDRMGVGTDTPVTKLGVSGDISIQGSNNELRFYEGVNYVGFEAPALAADQIWVLPSADGNASDFLQTDGAGTLSWAAGGGGGASPWTDGGVFLYPTATESLVIGGNSVATADIYLGAGGGAVFNEQGLDVDTRFEGSSDANLLYLDAGNDRVGISTATPTEKMDIRGSILSVNTTVSTVRGIQVNQHSTDAGGAIFLSTKSGGSFASPAAVSAGYFGGFFGCRWHDGTSYRRSGGFGFSIIGAVSSGVTPTRLGLYTSTTSNDGTSGYGPERLSILPNGNVGINNTNPAELLDIAGVVFCKKNVAGGLIMSLAQNPADPTTGISTGANLGFNSNPANFYGIGLGALRSSKYDIWFQTGVDNGGGYRFYFYGTNEKVTFDLNGNVGINTNTPTARVDINSDILRLRTAKTPSSAGDTGNQGDFAWDSTYFYICIATNTWQRVQHATW